MDGDVFKDTIGCVRLGDPQQRFDMLQAFRDFPEVFIVVVVCILFSVVVFLFSFLALVIQLLLHLTHLQTCCVCAC